VTVLHFGEGVVKQVSRILDIRVRYYETEPWRISSFSLYGTTSGRRIQIWYIVFNL